MPKGHNNNEKELVVVRTRITLEKREKLKMVASLNKISVDRLLKNAIDDIIDNDEALQMLIEAGKV